MVGHTHKAEEPHLISKEARRTAMKREGNLFDRIASIDNLLLADQRARRGKQRSHGVRLHDRNREANIATLHRMLTDGTFKTSKYSTFTIHEPKERLIYRLPYFPDRIVHHAVMNILEPIWTSVFTADTYSCIKGRGIHAAARKVRAALDSDAEGCKYCLKIDLRKFYPSIDHGVLKAIVRRRIKDARLLSLLDGIIDSADGLPIGNYLSQFLANLTLAYFDHWVKEVKRERHYFRYADDIVVMHADKGHLRRLLAEMEEKLRELRLEVKPNKQIFPVAASHRDLHARGVDFLGFVFYLCETRLRKRIKQNMCRKVARLRRRKRPLSAKAFRQAIAPWLGWCKYSDSEHLIYKLNSNQQPDYEIDIKHQALHTGGSGQRSGALPLQHRRGGSAHGK